MQKELTNKPEIKLVGLTARTNMKNEMDPQIAKIGATASYYFSQQTANQISNRKNPGITFAVYTEYESNEYGDYTYFIGEEVTSFEHVTTELKTLTIPASKYQRFTTPAEKMPEVVINAWQKIWEMTPDDLGGARAYQADFEIYDQRAADPNNTVLDIYIGIK